MDGRSSARLLPLVVGDAALHESKRRRSGSVDRTATARRLGRNPPARGALAIPFAVRQGCLIETHTQRIQRLLAFRTDDHRTRFAPFAPPAAFEQALRQQRPERSGKMVAAFGPIDAR